MSFCFPSVKKNNNQKQTKKKNRGISNAGRWFGDAWPTGPTVSPACRRRLKAPNLTPPLALTHPPPSFSLLLSLYYYYNHDYSQYQCLCYQFYYFKRFYHGSMIIIVISTLHARTHTCMFDVCMLFYRIFVESDKSQNIKEVMAPLWETDGDFTDCCRAILCTTV